MRSGTLKKQKSTTVLTHRSTKKPWFPIVTVVVAVGIVAGVYVRLQTQATTDDLWQSNFSSTSAGLASLGDGNPATVWDSKSNTTFGSYAGSDAWNIALPADTRNGTKVRARFQDMGFQPRSSVRLEYDVYVENVQALSLDIKLPGFGSLPEGQSLWNASSGGSKLPDSASIRIHARPSGHWGMTHPYLEAYAYAHNGGGKTFQDWGLYWRLSESMNATGQANGDEYAIPIGQWFTIAIEAEMNTPGNSDGKLRVWLDDNQGIDLDDMQWVKAAPYQWTQTMFETFYNVGLHPANSFHLANMNFKEIATTNPPTFKLGDVNGDEVVNGLDLSKILTSYAKTPATRTDGDLNGDGTVNALDLSQVLTHYGT